MFEEFQWAVQKAHTAAGRARFYTQLPASKERQAKFRPQLVPRDRMGQAALPLGTGQLMGK